MSKKKTTPNYEKKKTFEISFYFDLFNIFEGANPSKGEKNPKADT